MWRLRFDIKCMFYCESWSKKFGSHWFSLYFPRSRLSPLDLFNRAPLGNLLAIYSCQKTKKRSLWINLSQFLKHFPYSKVHDLILNLKWLYGYISMTRAISEKQLIFPLQKSEKKYAHKMKLQITPRKFGARKKFSDPAMFFHQMNHPGTEPTHVSHETHPMS